MDSVRDQLVNYIGDDLAVDLDGLSDDDLLFSAGLVDSFALISLMTFIETEFGFRISPGDVNLANFDSVGRMVDYVNAQRSITSGSR